MSFTFSLWFSCYQSCPLEICNSYTIPMLVYQKVSWFHINEFLSLCFMDWMWLIFSQSYFFIPLANSCQIALSNQTGMWESFLSYHQIFIVWSYLQSKRGLVPIRSPSFFVTRVKCINHCHKQNCVHIFQRLNQPSSQDIMLGLCTTKVRFSQVIFWHHYSRRCTYPKP